MNGTLKGNLSLPIFSEYLENNNLEIIMWNSNMREVLLE